MKYTFPVYKCTVNNRVLLTSYNLHIISYGYEWCHFHTCFTKKYIVVKFTIQFRVSCYQ